MNEGTSRRSRNSKILDPNYIKLDERSIQDMVSSTLEFSKKLIFYDQDHQPNGDWESFLLQEPIFIFSIISNLNISKFKDFVDKIEFNEDPNIKVKSLYLILHNLDLLDKDVQYWYDLLKKSNFENAIINEINSLKKSIDQKLEIIKMKGKTASW